jgi:peptide/nickel transport system permease protein
MTVSMSFIVGGTLGMVAGLVRGWFDRLVSFLFLVLLSFPGLVWVILIIALIDRSVLTISVTLAIAFIAPVGRLARAATLSFALTFPCSSSFLPPSPCHIILKHNFVFDGWWNCQHGYL